MEFEDPKPDDSQSPNPALNSSPPAPPTAAPQEDYRAASKSMATYAQQYPPKPKSDSKKWLWPVIILTLLIIAAAVYWFVIRSKPAAKTASSQTGQSSQSSQQAASTSPIATTTTSYSSTNFNLSFSYPTGWTVNDTGGKTMTVISPATQLKNATGQTVSGKIIMTISQKGQNLGAFDKGDATAVLDSQKITYSKPTPNQRANTYLSFLQYASTAATGALDGVDITGDYGYTKAQDIPKTDIANIDPLINITFAKCSDSACSATTALSIASTAWANTTFSAPLTTMLESLAIN